MILALVLCLATVVCQSALAAPMLRIAAASDLRFAMEAILEQFRDKYPDYDVTVVYGSSGRFHSQIENGAPFDLYFSADIAYPMSLKEAGLVAGEVMPYGRGRLVLWSRTLDVTDMTLADLDDPALERIAMANPRHAPYGARAREALESAGVWSAVQPRLVYGENIAQTLQMADSGAADLGIVALSLVLSPAMAGEGSYHRIDPRLHQPLEQGFVITSHGKDNATARRFADFFRQESSRRLLQAYGFEPPGSD
ncbi:MAG: molybdate ABC transporter substrate-binding protein [Oleiphilaceae bacterium]|nr:molybdate ABC transporter substrate-binding protein [Oleiphilaceae bacterium]